MIYRFGGFELDAARRSLRSIENARPVALTAKLFDVLLYLIEHRGQLVEKQAMLEAVWPNVIVEEANLPQTISMLRRALGEDSRLHEYIATIPGRGYQFVAAVEIVEPKPQPDAEQALRGTSAAAAAATLPREIAQPSWRRALPFAGAVMAGSLITAVVAASLWPEREPDRARPAVTRFDYDLGADQVLRNPGWPVLALSPDGRRFVYNTQQGLYLRSMDELEARLIPGTEESLNNPFFSPDGESVGYWALSGQLKRVALGGEAPVVISEIPGYVMGASWATDGTILYGQPEGIFRVSAKGGTPELVIPARDGEGVFGPQLLPDGDGVLFTIAAANTVGSEATQVVVESLSTRARTVLVAGGSDGRYLPTGHVVYARGNALFAVALGDHLTVSGSAVPLVQGIMRSVGGPLGTANYGVAADGTLVYVSGATIVAQRTLVWVDRTGREEPIAAPPRAYNYAQLSPDGTRVAVDIRDQEFDIWIWHLEDQMLRRLTFDPGFNRAPVWSPDGTHLAFSRPGIGGTREIYWQVADGTAPPTQLTEGSPGLVNASDFSSDGTTFLYGTMADPRRDIWTVPVKGPRTASTLLSERSAGQYNPTLSPDGRWLAYESRESGREEIYVRPFPDVDSGRWQISTGGGTRPDWSRDGRELFYIAPHGVTSTLMAVAVEAGTTFRPSRPEALFTRRYPSQGNEGRQIYDVSLDGQRFLMIKDAPPDSGAETQKIVIVPNWLEELERLVPTA